MGPIRLRLVAPVYCMCLIDRVVDAFHCGQLGILHWGRLFQQILLIRFSNFFNFPHTWQFSKFMESFQIHENFQIYENFPNL